MKKVIFLLLTFLSLSAFSQTINPADVKQYAIVVPSPGHEREFTSFLKKEKASIWRSYEQLGWFLIKFTEGSYAEFEKKCISKSFIKKVYPDDSTVVKRDYTPNDVGFPLQWHLKQSTDKDIDADEAWDLFPLNNPQTTVAVFDGGLEINHPDLIGRWNTPYNAATNASSAAFVNSYDKHGTACSGTICASTNNSIGGGSVGGGKVQVMPICIMSDVFSGGSFSTTSSIQIAAVNAAMANPTCVAISMSYGGSGFSQALSDAFTLASTTGRGGKGLLIFASTGNGASGTIVQYPASYSAVIGVGATSSTDARSSFSNYGNIVDISAPGSSIYTTDRIGIEGYASTSDYATVSGTSFSCPITAAAAASILYVNPQLTATGVMNILAVTAEKVGGYSYALNSSYPYSTRSVELGYGRINLKDAIFMAGTGEVPPPPTPKHNFVINLGSVTPNAVNIGQSVSISFTAETQNPSVTLASVKSQYRFSTDQTWSTDDIIIGSDTSSLGSGIATELESQSYVTPMNPGVRYILIKINYDNAVDESFNGDNLKIIPITLIDPLAAGTDLSISFTAPTTSVVNLPSTQVSLNYQIKVTNTGTSTVTSFSYSRGWENCSGFTTWSCVNSYSWSGNLLPGQSVYLPNGINSWVSTAICSSTSNCAIPLGGTNTLKTQFITVNGSSSDANPANNVATVIVNRLMPAIVDEYQIYTITGMPIKITKDPNYMNELQSGMYIVHEVSKDGVNVVKIEK